MQDGKNSKGLGFKHLNFVFLPWNSQRTQVKQHRCRGSAGKRAYGRWKDVVLRWLLLPPSLSVRCAVAKAASREALTTIYGLPGRTEKGKTSAR